MKRRLREISDLLPEILAVGFMPLVAIGCIVPWVFVR